MKGGQQWPAEAMTASMARQDVQRGVGVKMMGRQAGEVP